MITVQVQKRGCGYPKPGFYAIGGGVPSTCFALPVELKPCDCCDQQPKFARCPTPVKSAYLTMLFSPCLTKDPGCRNCIQDRRYWISWIGSDYTAESFNRETHKQGLSRRLPPSFAKTIKPGDYFANVKNDKIISIIAITTVRYYASEADDAKKISELEKAGIEVAKMELVDEAGQPVQAEVNFENEEENFD